jgi:hypothetical protein
MSFRSKLKHCISVLLLLVTVQISATIINSTSIQKSRIVQFYSPLETPGLLVINLDIENYLVFIDGIRPVSSNDGIYLNPGRHEIKIMKNGYHTIKDSITVYKEKGILYKSDFIPKNGTLETSIFPADAKFTLELNGRIVEKSNNRFSSLELPVGKYLVTVEKKGYITHKELIDIKSDKNNYFKCIMQKGRNFSDHVSPIGIQLKAVKGKGQTEDFYCSNYILSSMISSRLRWKTDKIYDSEQYVYLDFLKTLSYCNQLSIKEGLEPCYYYKENMKLIDKYFNPACDQAICIFENNGYRLPTEHEWKIASNMIVLKPLNKYYRRTRPYPGFPTIFEYYWNSTDESLSIPIITKVRRQIFRRTASFSECHGLRVVRNAK